MAEFEGKVALVTGAASGLGAAVARELAASGASVLLTDLAEESLGEVAASCGKRATTALLDVTDEAQWASAVTAAEECFGALHLLVNNAGIITLVPSMQMPTQDFIDVLVNNAGNSRIGRFDTVPWEDHQARLHLMGISTWRLVHGVLPGMVERGRGRIINVSSIAALFTGFPTDVTYNATKGMVVRFSEAIDAEYRGAGVRCTVSLPGPTPTEIFTQPGSSGDVAHHPLFRHLQTSPATVARQTYAAAMAGKPFIVPGLQFKPLAAALQYAPAALRRKLSVALCKVMNEREKSGSR